MNELGPDARALLEVARDGDDPTSADRARVRGSIGARLAIGAAAAGVAITAATTSSASAAGASASVGAGAAAAGAGAIGAGAASVAAPIGIGMKLLLVFGAATAVGVGAVSYVESSPPSHSAPAQTPARPSLSSSIASARPAPIAKPLATIAPAATSSAAPETSGSTAPSAAPQAIAPSAPPSSPTTSPSAIDRELGLVREALAALQSGDGARALVLLDEHARRYPSGALSEEREATRVFALCSLGRTGEARAAADRFLRAFPRSPQAARVRSSCGGDPTSF